MLSPLEEPLQHMDKTCAGLCWPMMFNIDIVMLGAQGG